MSKVVKIECFRYSLDWYDIYTKEFNLETHPFFDIEFRLGSWFLTAYKKLDASPWYKEEYMESFELNNPAKTVFEMRPYIRGYRAGCSSRDTFPDAITKLMKDVQLFKEQSHEAE